MFIDKVKSLFLDSKSFKVSPLMYLLMHEFCEYLSFEGVPIGTDPADEQLFSLAEFAEDPSAVGLDSASSIVLSIIDGCMEITTENFRNTIMQQEEACQNLDGAIEDLQNALEALSVDLLEAKVEGLQQSIKDAIEAAQNLANNTIPNRQENICNLEQEEAAAKKLTGDLKHEIDEIEAHLQK